MKLLISSILFLSLILSERSMNPQIDINIYYRMVDPDSSGGASLSPKITENELIDKDILEEVIRTKDIYYDTNICLTCLKLIQKDIVKSVFYSIMTNCPRTISKATFLNSLVENIDEDFEISNYNLRRLSDEQHTIAFFFNQKEQDVYNCAEGNKQFYQPNAQAIQSNVEEKKGYDCISTLYAKQLEKKYEPWKTELCTLYYQENQTCYTNIGFNTTVLSRINIECNDDE